MNSNLSTVINSVKMMDDTVVGVIVVLENYQ
jgi:hypothetical protein